MWLTNETSRGRSLRSETPHTIINVLATKELFTQNASLCFMRQVAAEWKRSQGLEMLTKLDKAS